MKKTNLALPTLFLALTLFLPLATAANIEPLPSDNLPEAPTLQILANIQALQASLISFNTEQQQRFDRVYSDINAIMEKQKAFEKKVDALQNEVNKKPSMAVVAVTVLASGAIISGIFVGLKISGKW